MHKHLKSSYLFSEPLVDPESHQRISAQVEHLVEKHRLECPYSAGTVIPRHILQSKNRKMKLSRLFGLRPSPTVNNNSDQDNNLKENRGKLKN